MDPAFSKPNSLALVKALSSRSAKKYDDKNFAVGGTSGLTIGGVSTSSEAECLMISKDLF
jgi:hypothetical protein